MYHANSSDKALAKLEKPAHLVTIWQAQLITSANTLPKYVKGGRLSFMHC
jgi:hypothetical protein